MTDERPLCVIQTPVLEQLLFEAKHGLVREDYNFAAEIGLAEHQHRDPSLVARRVLRDFIHQLKIISFDEWERYRAVYQEHRDASNQTQLHLRIGEQGRTHIEQVRAYLEADNELLLLMRTNENRGQKLPNVMILTCALQWEIDQFQKKVGKP